jgi:hypothetical protein
MATDDEIIKIIGINHGIFENNSDLEGLKEDINQMLNKARADTIDLILSAWDALYSKYLEQELTCSNDELNMNKMKNFVKEFRAYLEMMKR